MQGVFVENKKSNSNSSSLRERRPLARVTTVGTPDTSSTIVPTLSPMALLKETCKIHQDLAAGVTVDGVGVTVAAGAAGVVVVMVFKRRMVVPPPPYFPQRLQVVTLDYLARPYRGG